MVHQLLRRILISIPLIVVVSLLTFVLQAFIPGNAAMTILGVTATRQQYQELDNQLHLNEPVWTQYVRYMSSAVRGNLGTSIFTGEPVLTSLLRALPVTLSLVCLATLLCAGAGVLLGMASAIRGGLVGRVVNTVSVLGFALPNFWVGLMLIYGLAIAVPLFPATGYVSFGVSPSEWLASLVLPALALGLGGIAGVAKMTQDGMLEALDSDYIRTLRACGASRWSVLWKHALRNASTSVLTVIGLIFVGMLSGSVVIENVFALPGLGSLAVSAVTQHDIPVVEGVAIAFTVLVIVSNTLIDFLQALLNPKVRA